MLDVTEVKNASETEELKNYVLEIILRGGCAIKIDLDDTSDGALKKEIIIRNGMKLHDNTIITIGSTEGEGTYDINTNDIMCFHMYVK